MKRLAFIICALMSFIGVQAAETAQPQHYDLTICQYDSSFFAADNDVYMTLYTEDNVVTIRVDVIVEEGQQFFTSGKTYTWDDMLHPYCNAYVSAEFRHYPFADATFMWTLDEQGLEHIAGNATDTLGNTYSFHYDELPFIPTGDTIEMTFPEAMKLEHHEGAAEWYFIGSKEPYYIVLTLLNEGESPVGEYTMENIETSFSYIEKNLGGGEYEWLDFHDAHIAITAAEDDTLRIESTILAEDGNVYAFHLFYLAPKSTKKVTINATDLYINSDYLYGMIGAFKVEASNDDYEVRLVFSPMDEDLSIYGTYQIANTTPNAGYVWDYNVAEEEASEVYQGTVTITKTATGALVTGTILCYDNTEYTLNLSYAVPEKTRDAEFIADGMELKLSQGAWRISGYNADSTQFISLVFNGLGVAGEYNIVTMSPLYSYVVTDVTWSAGEVDSYTYFNVVSADLQVTFDETDSIVTVTGSVVAQNRGDVPQFRVQVSNKPSKHEDVETVKGSAVATKRMENNMLIIEKNGRKYNVLGTIMQ